ncbi:MAG: DNA-directed RNA polymerase subunit K [Nanoarchaeota archaeon]|nr:DNA-directed RNA polymerase subunit K [Nanoarchaeota archaeon]
MAEKQEFSKYERARIIGARGLQISMDAPLLTKMSEEDLNGVNYDPLRIAEKELDSGVLPISVNRPMPERKEEPLEKIKIEESKISDAAKEEAEKQEERDIAAGGEMMELADSGEEPEIEEEDESPIAEIPTEDLE